MQVSPEGLKHMAVKQAEPLMAKLEKNPNDADLLAQIAKTYLVGHQFDSAAEYYERSVKIKPDVRTLTTLGGAYHLAGADDKALGAWKRALKIDPNYADALFNYGLIEWKSQSDPNAAIVAWTKLLQANPNHPQRARVEEMIALAKKDAEKPAGATK
jgi:cytochrome c-type biogenesis protein CcmH/NrfG